MGLRIETTDPRFFAAAERQANKRLAAIRKREELARTDPTLSMDAWGALLKYAGNTYVGQPSLSGSRKEISQSFQGYVQGIYKSNAVAFAIIAARQLLFSEVRFQWRQMRNGRPGDLFGTQELQILEEPWPNGTTGDLLARAELDVSLEGNFFAFRGGDQLRRMRPDWVSIALSGTDERDVEVVGYGYHRGGYNSGQPPQVMLPEEVMHYYPYPDPAARYRGMSWMTPVLEELRADDAMNQHKQKFFENGATANTVATLDPSIGKEAFNAWVEAFKRGHEGVENAYKTLFLGGGADVKVIGSNMQQVTFKEIQGAGETRIAAAAGVAPIWAGLSEGLQYATYSNYAQATRRLADGTMRPLWRNFAASASRILVKPGGAELWYDDRDVPFLQDDQSQAATIQQTKAATIHTLIASGYEPDSVIQAVANNDLSLLSHTGLFSVQLQPAGSVTEGKGAAVGGTVVPAGAAGKETLTPGQAAPAMVGKNGARALLEPWLPPLLTEGDE